jgi:peptidoglycan/LPS O-acetylase OafA/YrhL
VSINLPSSLAASAAPPELVQPAAEPRAGGGAAARRAAFGARLRAFADVGLDANRLPALDGVRAVAASLVFVVHYQAAFGPLLLDAYPSLNAAADFAAGIGYHGVTVFFMLSGFLIYGSLVGKPIPYTTFFKRRVQRIYPTYLVVLLLYLLLGSVFRSRSKLPSEGVATYVLQNALLLPGVFEIPPIVTVSWSLSYEIFFYLGLAAAVALLQLRRWTPRARAALLAALLVGWGVSGAASQRVAGSFIMFVPGLLVWEAWRARRDALRPHVPAWLAWTLFGALLPVAAALDAGAVSQRLTAVGLRPSTLNFALLTLAVVPLLWHALGTPSDRPSVLAWRPVRYVGVISYSFYLLHGLTINALALGFATLFGPVSAPYGPVVYCALLPVVYLAAVVTSTALFRGVERPLSL